MIRAYYTCEGQTRVEARPGHRGPQSVERYRCPFDCRDFGKGWAECGKGAEGGYSVQEHTESCTGMDITKKTRYAASTTGDFGTFTVTSTTKCALLSKCLEVDGKASCSVRKRASPTSKSAHA